MTNLNNKQIEIANKIISLLEKGNLNWIKSWKTGLPKNIKTKKDYRGINSIILNILMQENQWKTPLFASFLQIKELGGCVKKGEKAIPVFFYQMIEREYEQENENGDMEAIRKKYPLLRIYNVFNIEQTTLEIPEKEKKEFEPIAQAEMQIKKYLEQIKIKFGGSRAFYCPPEDFVQLPQKENFVGSEEYYSVLNHELSHSTGHKSRLAREGITEATMFGNEDYSKEEVIAELSSCFLCASAGIENKTINNSSAYLKSWIDNLKQDKNFLFKVIGQAQKSADFIINFGVDKK